MVDVNLDVLHSKEVDQEMMNKSEVGEEEDYDEDEDMLCEV